MKQANLIITLTFIQLFTLVTTLFICSTNVPFFPWFIKKGFGWIGIFITAPVLLIIGTIMTYYDKKKNTFYQTNETKYPFHYCNFLHVCLLFLFDR